MTILDIMEDNKIMVLYLKFHHRVDILIISKTLKLLCRFILWFRIGILGLYKNVISWVACSGSFTIELAQDSFIVIVNILWKKPASTLPFIILFPTPEQLKN